MSSATLDVIFSNVFRLATLILILVVLRVLTRQRAQQALIQVEELPTGQYVVRCIEHGPVGVADETRKVGRLVFAHFVDAHNLPRDRPEFLE